jgi:hypothetical protein
MTTTAGGNLENHHEWIDVHGNFSEKVEGLLMEKLGAVGLSDEAFMDAVNSAAESSRDINQGVIDMLLAVDDFEVFQVIICLIDSCD